MPEKARKYEAVAGFAPAGAVVSVPFVLLHRRIARGERRRPRALKRQPRFVGVTAVFWYRKSAYIAVSAQLFQDKTTLSQ